MIEPKEVSPLDGYEVHGIKAVDVFDYYLLIADKGECVIAKVAQDDSSTSFVKMAPNPAHVHFHDIAADIAAFWVNPETHTYQNLFEC